MKKRVTSAVFVVFLILTLVFPAQATDLEPPVEPDPLSPYVGVISTGAGLSRLSNGKAQATGLVNLNSGYHANASLSIYKEGSSTPIITWTQSSTYVWISQSYSVASGFTYYATISAKIYDSNDNEVDTVNISSVHVYFP